MILNKYKKIYYNVPGKNLQFDKSVLKNYRYNKIKDQLIKIKHKKILLEVLND